MNASDFSQGQKILLQLAFAQSYDAQVYFFDEPTGNLDVEFRDKFYETIRELAADENKCIIYATHLVEELEHFADIFYGCKRKTIAQANSITVRWMSLGIPTGLFPGKRHCLRGYRRSL